AGREARGHHAPRLHPRSHCREGRPGRATRRLPRRGRAAVRGARRVRESHPVERDAPLLRGPHRGQGGRARDIEETGALTMSAIELAPELAEDFERILEDLASNAADDVAARIQDIVRAVDVLERNPLIGRPAGGDLRELVIGRRSRSYVAAYLYVDEIDTVFVLALRSQR